MEEYKNIILTSKCPNFSISNLPYVSYSGEFFAKLGLENIWFCNLIHNDFNEVPNSAK